MSATPSQEEKRGRDLEVLRCEKDAELLHASAVRNVGTDMEMRARGTAPPFTLSFHSLLSLSPFTLSFHSLLSLSPFTLPLPSSEGGLTLI